MDKLKEYINNNREAFDTYEIPEGFEHRFEHRLSSRPQKQVLPIIVSLVAMAACFLFLIYILPQRTRTVTPGATAAAKEQAAERKLEDISQYYTFKMNTLMDSIHSEAAKNDIMPVKQILAEAQRIYREKVNFEDNEIGKLPPTGKSFGVIYTFYSTKVDNLELLLSLATGKGI